MKEAGRRLVQFFRELRRRRMVREALAYGVFAWVTIEISSVILPAFDAPEWVLQVIIVAFVAGFPLALVASWFFDITTEGIERTDELIGHDGDEALLLEAPGDEPDAADAELLAFKPSVALDMGSADRRLVTLLRCTFALTVGDREREQDAMLDLLPRLEEFSTRIAEQYSAELIVSSSGTFEFLFGYPQAYENDSVRAVAAGLNILNESDVIADDTLDAMLATVAITTELVVVEKTDEHPLRVVGMASQMAAWMQMQVAPDSVVLDEPTFQQLRDRVKCDELGEMTNPQLGVSAMLYRAREFSESAVLGNGESAALVVGRESEIALIMDRWERALDGEEQFIVLRGEAGIGKSTLIKETIKRAGETAEVLVMPMFCSSFTSNQAFSPIIDYLNGSVLGLERHHSEEERASRVRDLLTDIGLDSDRIGPIIEKLLSFQRSGLDPESRAEMLDSLLEVFKASANRQPVILVFEDLHWADPSTMEVIDLLVNQVANMRVLGLFTTRPTTELGFESKSNVATLNLQRLSRRMTERLVGSILGDLKLAPEFVEQIVAETAGNPLFVEELSKAVAESRDPEASDDVSALELPGTIQQSLAARIDNLGDAKPLVQLCSLLGRSFSYELLMGVSKTQNEDLLREELQVLVKSEFLLQDGTLPDCYFTFRHALVQDAAYQSLLKATRMELHGQVAEILETQFTGFAEESPELLAFHLEESGQIQKSVGFWTQACQRALDFYSLQEAKNLAKSGLSALHSLPESRERDQQDLVLTGLLGRALVSSTAYTDPQVEETYSRALELCESVGDAPQMFPLVVGMWMYFQVKGEYEESLSLAQRLVRMAKAQGDLEQEFQAHYCIGFTNYFRGDFAATRSHFEQALAIEKAEGPGFSFVSLSGDDTRVHIKTILASVLWHDGENDEAERLLSEGVQLALDHDNPMEIVWAKFQYGVYSTLREDWVEALAYTKPTVEICREKGLIYFLILSEINLAWIEMQLDRLRKVDDLSSHARKMEEAFGYYKMIGCKQANSHIYNNLINSLICVGELDRAGAYIEEALEDAEARGERYMEPELFITKGVLALELGDAKGAQAAFAEAEVKAQEIGSVPLINKAHAHLRKESGALQHG